MANIIIPKSSDEKVNTLMGHAGIEHRPTILRIALSKGIFHFKDELPEVSDKTNGREIPIRTLCPDDNLLIIKHCLIQKLDDKIVESKTLNNYIRKGLIYGIDIMVKELSTLDSLDNYLLYLVSNIGEEYSESKNDNYRIHELLGL